MAPRRQAKQAAAESVVVAAAADGNVTPPKKRKMVAKQASDEPKQIKGRTTRQAKADKQESEAGGPASPPKKSRGKQKSAAGTTAVAKTDTRGKSKKQANKEPEDATVDNHVGEEVAEKKTRGGKAATTAKKAGTKATTAKPKVKAPAAKKQKTRATDEEDAGDSGKNVAGAGPAKRTTRRMKVVEENDAQAKPPAKAPRKRKNADEAVLEAQAAKEEEEEEEEEEENEVKAKKPRSRAKKVEPDAPMTTSRGRAKKNPAKEVAKPPPEEAEIKKQNGKEQNAAVQEDNSKAKNVKNAKKGNAKKAAPRRKLDAAAGKADEQAQAEEAAIPEVDVKENGEEHVAELKQKKKNAGKAIAAVNGKVEAKGRQKKGQAAATSIDEKEATKDETNETSENETTEMNAAPEMDETIDVKDVSLIKEGNVLQSEEKATDLNDSKADSTKNDSETSVKDLERSGTFLCF